MVGCSYDDSAILDKIAEMEKEHDEMQAQIDAQQTLLDALANKLTITAVTETENGYIVKFSDGSTATISDGKDGDSFIESIVVGEEDVTFTLADGTVIVIPLGSGGSSDGGEPSAEDNKIYYTTSDGKKLFPNTSEPAAFGAILVSNTYKDGQGVLVFDDAITSIAEKAFYECTSLTSITIPDSVTSIGGSAFNGCSSLTSVTIPDSVTSIGRDAFYRCHSLPIENNIRYADTYLVEVVDKTQSAYIIKEGTRFIGAAAFSDCTLLTSITIPDSVTEIINSTFSDCSSLTSITIPEGVTSIGDSAFYKCSSLKSITIPDSVTSIGESAFRDCSSLASITIPEGVTSIGSSTFRDCSSLTSITIPDGITEIGYLAFSDCSSLTNVTIPDSVTSISSGAFSDCRSLAEVYCKATTPPTAYLDGFSYWSALYNNASGRKIYVPAESVDAYKTAKYWRDYAADIVGYDFE